GCAERSMTMKSLVKLAQSLGIRSIAEGVERGSTATALRVIGCDGAQGWHFARPLNATMATEWLAEEPVRTLPAALAVDHASVDRASVGHDQAGVDQASAVQARPAVAAVTGSSAAAASAAGANPLLAQAVPVCSTPSAT